MQNNIQEHSLDLQLFADGAAAQAQAVPAETNSGAGSSRRPDTGAGPTQPSAAGEAKGTDGD